MSEMIPKIDRSHWPVRIGRLEDEDDEPDPVDLSQLFEQMWQLAVNAWVFKRAGEVARGEVPVNDESTDGQDAEHQLHRHVVRILRPQR